MEATAATVDGDLDSPAEVLAAVRSETAAAHRAEARKLELAVDWAAMHSADSIYEAATLWAPRLCFEEEALPIAGEGAPLVAEFAVAEFAAALGLPTEHGRAFLGEALELRYRLPRVWRRVLAGDLAPWRARRIARETVELSQAAVTHVDRHVEPVAHKIGPAQTQRLVEEAIARFMPETAEATRRQAADSRHLEVDHHQVSFAGTSLVHGELDLADALDLDAALAAEAAALKDLGSTESLDVRRSIALGALARRQLPLNLEPAGDGSVVEEVAQQPSRNHPRPVRREVVLYLHLHQTALEGTGDPTGCGVGRVENTRSPVTAEQIRLWCANPDARVTVKPVLDLADHVSTEAYEVPDRIAEAVALRDHACVFPWCTRPARRLRPDQHGCDCDHVVPHSRGGVTCTCQLAPLCRRHHRLKTHGRWTYTTLEPGTYLWRSPHGYHYLRDHTGTLDVTSDHGRQPTRAPHT
jgi:hypothetical protein